MFNPQTIESHITTAHDMAQHLEVLSTAMKRSDALIHAFNTMMYHAAYDDDVKEVRTRTKAEVLEQYRELDVTLSTLEVEWRRAYANLKTVCRECHEIAKPFFAELRTWLQKPHLLMEDERATLDTAGNDASDYLISADQCLDELFEVLDNRSLERYHDWITNRIRTLETKKRLSIDIEPGW